MNITAKPGSMVIFPYPKKVIFNPEKRDKKFEPAVKHLVKVGGEYTVERAFVHESYTGVYLKEVPNIMFNAKDFEDKLLEEQRKMYVPNQEGFPKLRVQHRKARRVGKKIMSAQYLVKCGCCKEKIEIYYGDGLLEINGVDGSIRNWREILLPLLGE